MRVNASQNVGIGTNNPQAQLHIGGTTPTVIIGDGDEEDIKLILDGNAQDYYIGLADSGDKFLIGKGTNISSNRVIEISDGISSKPQVGVGYAGANPMSLSYTGTAFAVSEQTGTASVQIDGGNAARMDFGVGGTALFRMYSDTSNYTEFKRTTNHPIIFNTNNTEIFRILSTEVKLASGKKLVGGASNVDFTIQSEHRIEFIGASKGTVIFKDQGTAYGLLERPTGTNDFDIQNPISDGDITFVGNDGGSGITALTLDMSEAGKAIFNAEVQATQFLGDVVNGHTAETSFANDDLIAVYDTSASAIRKGTLANVLAAASGTTINNNADNRIITGSGSSGTLEAETGLTYNSGTLAQASGDFILDIAADIVLDADGGNIEMKDDGLHFYSISRSVDNVILQSVIQDGDIIFQGNDGGSLITALTLDMSSEGGATFNGNITLNDNKGIYFGAGSDLIISSDGTNGAVAAANGGLTLDVQGDITFDAGGGDILLKDDGTLVGTIGGFAGNNVTIKSEVSDGDVIFQGNDGGSGINALTLDMSEAGKAIFNSNSIEFDFSTATTVEGLINMPRDESNQNAAKSLRLRANNFLTLEYGQLNLEGHTSGNTQTTFRTLTIGDIQDNGQASYTAGTSGQGASSHRFLVYDGSSNSPVSVLALNAATGATFFQNIKNNSGDFTVDVDGDLHLDADGEHVTFKDGGTEIGNIDMGSQNLTLRSKVSDKDIIFRGNDGGTDFTALTLDMSEAGAATFNDNVTAFSDVRLKTNIKTLKNGLEKVESLRGVSYFRNDKENIGVIAQEIEEILPEIVRTADDEMGTKSVDYGRITAVLIEAVKELSERVKDLEGK
jgi:hypothetical protein